MVKTLILLISLNLDYQEDHRAQRLELSNKEFILDSIRYKTLDRDCIRVMFKSGYCRLVYNYER